MAKKRSIPPTTGRGDIAYATAKGALSAVPYVGGAAAELLQLILKPPIEKRRDEWMASLADRLAHLESAEAVKVADLGESPEFVTAVLHATQIALRTHETAKLEALRHAVTNVARGRSPGEMLRHVFLLLIDDLTETHLQLLKALQAPPAPPGLDMGGLIAVVEYILPQLKGQRELSALLWHDLVARGLIIKPDDLHMTMSQIEFGRKRTTSLGDRFLEFISDPTSLRA